LVELETKIADSLGISFGCQFFGNYLPRSIGDVFAIGHVSPEGHTCARIANITLGTSPFAIVSRRAEPETLIKTMAAVVQSLDPNLPWAHPISMHSLLAEVRAGERFEAILFGGFAVVALGIQPRGHEAGREWLARLFPASACAADRSDRSPCAKNRRGSRGLRLALSRVAIYVASLR
jgi:hypothetical protein